MIDAKQHYRRLVTKLGGLDAVALATSRKRQTIAAYFNTNNPQQPTAEIMLELQSLAGDYAYHHACSLLLGIDDQTSILARRERMAAEVLNGSYDELLTQNPEKTSEEAA